MLKQARLVFIPIALCHGLSVLLNRTREIGMWRVGKNFQLDFVEDTNRLFSTINFISKISAFEEQHSGLMGGEGEY